MPVTNGMMETQKGLFDKLMDELAKITDLKVMRAFMKALTYLIGFVIGASIIREMAQQKLAVLEAKDEADRFYSQIATHTTLGRLINPDQPKGYVIHLKDDSYVYYEEEPTWAKTDRDTWNTYALPASALPASALPANALPSSALPSSALPASALPASSIPDLALPASITIAQNYGSELARMNVSGVEILPRGALPSSDAPLVKEAVRPLMTFSPLLRLPSGVETVPGGSTAEPPPPSDEGASSGNTGSEMVVGSDPCRETFADARIYTNSADEPTLVINIVNDTGFLFDAYELDVGTDRTFPCSFYSETRLICSGAQLPSGVSGAIVTLHPAEDICALLTATVTIMADSSGSEEVTGSEQVTGSGTDEPGGTSPCPPGEEYHEGSGCCTIGCWCDIPDDNPDWGWGCYNNCPGCPP